VRYIIFLFIALAIGNTLNAQLCNYKLYGHVEDADTKEKLIAATITIKENGQQFITDNKGDFVFSKLCAGNYTVLIAHIGCDSVEKKITITKDVHIDILLPHSSKVLSSITVNSQKTIANTGFKKELSGRNLEETKGLSLAEALSKMNGVTMLQTGSTISKPVIHGLHSNRILTINNGVRQEGQQWGNEHAPEIDPFIADKLIVIKGVDELRYGSDAIGGVILVEPKPLRNLPGQAAEVNAGYFTNNKQYVISGVFEQQLKKYPVFRYRLQGTFKKGANVATPNYRLNNTGNEEKSFSITTGFKKETFNTELFYSHYNTKVGIFLGSHIGNLTDLQAAIASPQPNAIFLGQNTYNIQRPFQEVTHSLLKSKTAIYKGEHKFTILLAGQFNSRKEYDIVRSTTNQNPQLDLSINTYTQDVSWEHPKRNNFSGVAGIAATQQSNSYKGRYFIPNYFSYAFGGYYIEKWSKHKWELQGGIRYDNKSINTTRLKFNADTINYDFNFSTLASSFNAIFKPNNHWKINSNISFASRAPHVNELLSDGIHHGTATYEKGDITLKPEHAINISVGINYQHPSDKFSIDVLLYTNGIKNFIYQQPMPSNPVLTIAGAFPLIEYKQTDAVLSGIDVSTNVLLSSSVNWVSKFSFLNARNTTTSDWLILMPANRCNNEIAYNFKDGKIFSNTYASIEIANVMEQKNIPSDVNGKQDYKAPPPAYTLVNCNAATTTNIGKVPVTLSLGVRNILNTTYRDYLNSMRYFSDEMGRNISFRLKIQL
jgi:iron complex outermembrane recepter protein